MQQHRASGASCPSGFSLVELMVVVTLVGLVAGVILSRMTGGDDAANIAACYVYKGDIEVQAELWHHNTGAWPAANLSSIGADLNYFPAGLPTCPVDSSTYTIDAATGRVNGHNH